MWVLRLPDNTKDLSLLNTKVLVTSTHFAAEKLSPVLTMYKATSHENAFDISYQLLHYGGEGHLLLFTPLMMVVLLRHGLEMRASRIIVNSPSGIGGIGNIYNMNPSLPLGTGSYVVTQFLTTLLIGTS